MSLVAERVTEIARAAGAAIAFVDGKKVRYRGVAGKMGAAKPILKGIAAIVPDLHLFYVSGSMVGSDRVTVHGDYVDWTYVASATGYGLGYAAILLLLAAIIFRKRDFV